jgi:hypothetical protein
VRGDPEGGAQQSEEGSAAIQQRERAARLILVVEAESKSLPDEERGEGARHHADCPQDQDAHRMIIRVAPAALVELGLSLQLLKSGRLFFQVCGIGRVKARVPPTTHSPDFSAHNHLICL